MGIEETSYQKLFCMPAFPKRVFFMDRSRGSTCLLFYFPGPYLLIAYMTATHSIA